MAQEHSACNSKNENKEDSNFHDCASNSIERQASFYFNELNFYKLNFLKKKRNYSSSEFLSAFHPSLLALIQSIKKINLKHTGKLEEIRIRIFSSCC